MKSRFFFISVLILLLNACAPEPQVSATQASATRAAPALTMTRTLPPTPTATATSTPTDTLTLTATSIPTIAPTAAEAFTPTPAFSSTPLPNERQSPLTLMLHRPSAIFDSIAFLKVFIAILREEEMRVVTYRDLSENPALTATDHGKLFIITLDDIYLRYPIASEVLEMIELLKEAGYPAVLGVITESDYVYPDTAATLTGLSKQGWEIASHSDRHINLVDIQQIAPKSIFPEIKSSLDKIEEAVGLRPISLVLPFGQMTMGDEQIKRSRVRWVVGINGGTTYRMTAAYYYVGRESPGDSARETFETMLLRFGK